VVAVYHIEKLAAFNRSLQVWPIQKQIYSRHCNSNDRDLHAVFFLDRMQRNARAEVPAIGLYRQL
jgi:hypothetical protein